MNRIFAIAQPEKIGTILLSAGIVIAGIGGAIPMNEVFSTAGLFISAGATGYGTLLLSHAHNKGRGN